MVSSWNKASLKQRNELNKLPEESFKQMVSQKHGLMNRQSPPLTVFLKKLSAIPEGSEKRSIANGPAAVLEIRTIFLEKY